MNLNNILKLTVVNELVKLYKQLFVLGDADRVALMVIFRSKEYTYDCVRDSFLTVDRDVVVVRFVIQSLQMGQNLLLNLLLLLLLANFRNYRLEVNVEVVEEGGKLTDINFLDGNTRENKVVPLVRWERLLVLLVEVHNFLKQLVEGRIVNSSLAEFKS